MNSALGANAVQIQTDLLIISTVKIGAERILLHYAGQDTPAETLAASTHSRQTSNAAVIRNFVAILKAKHWSPYLRHVRSSFVFLFNDDTRAQFAMTVKLSDKENAVETELVARVRALGGRAEKVTVMGTRGFFDRLVILPGGRVIFCECKRPRGGRMSAHQIERARVYTALGAVVAVVANSADIDALLNEQGPRS
jgi:hypothetical protein